jgi:hypothetical protein
MVQILYPGNDADWRLGVKVRVFHLGDYRREALGSRPIPDDYFWTKATDETKRLRKQILETCRTDLLRFFDEENGQVGIYDAVNPTSAHRRDWKNLLDEHDIQTIFVESLCDDQEIIEQNVRNVKISSPDVCPPSDRKLTNSTLDGTRMMQSKITLLESTLRFQITNLSTKLISHISNSSMLINVWKFVIHRAISHPE